MTPTNPTPTDELAEFTTGLDGDVETAADVLLSVPTHDVREVTAVLSDTA